MDYLSKEQLGSLMAVLIAQLSRNKVLSPEDFDMMKGRLIDGGDEEVADAIDSVLLSDMLGDPERRRASIHAIRPADGGKSEG
ncbi:hypothetical protein GTZ99_12460 [Novosphingobium sp. FSY-8]|uniref:CARD domain-containing protein n=1 Tax=Novosphingobium ovatum TaxID=1908523 RepID=A0ABW9XFP1_9SPHN|nr:hypothetical protein [Novosphingobium ovatum]NBC37363.1 hypothetical protein [Novosphingobium ovatum]